MSESTALVPSDDADVPLEELPPKKLREVVRGELAGRSLAGWESEYCRWEALQDKTPPEKVRLAVARALANRMVHRKELQTLRKRGPFVRMLAKEKGSQIDQEIEAAKEIAAKVMAPGMRLAGRMIEASHEALDNAYIERDGVRKFMPSAALDVVRAATPLTNNLLERVMPKKHDGTAVQPQITIHLSSHQVARIDAPALAIEAEDVPYEIIADESGAV